MVEPSRGEILQDFSDNANRSGRENSFQFLLATLLLNAQTERLPLKKIIMICEGVRMIDKQIARNHGIYMDEVEMIYPIAIALSSSQRNASGRISIPWAFPEEEEYYDKFIKPWSVLVDMDEDGMLGHLKSFGFGDNSTPEYALFFASCRALTDLGLGMLQTAFVNYVWIESQLPRAFAILSEFVNMQSLQGLKDAIYGVKKGESSNVRKD